MGLDHDTLRERRCGPPWHDCQQKETAILDGLHERPPKELKQDPNAQVQMPRGVSVAAGFAGIDMAILERQNQVRSRTVNHVKKLALISGNRRVRVTID